MDFNAPLTGAYDNQSYHDMAIRSGSSNVSYNTSGARNFGGFGGLSDINMHDAGVSGVSSISSVSGTSGANAHSASDSLDRYSQASGTSFRGQNLILVAPAHSLTRGVENLTVADLMQNSWVKSLLDDYMRASNAYTQLQEENRALRDELISVKSDSNPRNSWPMPSVPSRSSSNSIAPSDSISRANSSRPFTPASFTSSAIPLSSGPATRPDQYPPREKASIAGRKRASSANSSDHQNRRSRKTQKQRDSVSERSHVSNNSRHKKKKGRKAKHTDVLQESSEVRESTGDDRDTNNGRESQRIIPPNVSRQRKKKLKTSKA